MKPITYRAPSMPNFSSITPFRELVFSVLRDFPFESSRSNNKPYPPVNAFWKESKLVIEMALAGWSRDDISIYIDQSDLVIESSEGYKSRNSKPSLDIIRLKCEISSASFQRIFKLPLEIIDLQTIESTLKDGLLRITFNPKPGTGTKRLQINPST